MAMGSSSSSTYRDFEKMHPPQTWLRYKDDNFIFWSQWKYVKVLLDYMNLLKPFTQLINYERKEN